MGSPRKSDSFRAVQMLEERMNGLGVLEFEYLFLKDADLKICKGCHTCFKAGEENCPLKDDRDKIIEKMKAADGILFVTPVHCQTVSVLMKNFIDRTSYFWHRPAFVGKKAAIVGVGSGMMKELHAYLKTVVRAYGMTNTGALAVPHLDELTPNFYGKIMKDFDKFAARVFKAFSDDHPPKPTMGDVAWFQIWKVTNRDFGLPLDYKYWKERGWLDMPYYSKERLGIFKRILGGIFAGLMAGGMKGVYRKVTVNDQGETNE